MTTTNKIPTFNSIVDLKTHHNEMIDSKSKHGYYNLIANNRFDSQYKFKISPLINRFLYWNTMSNINITFNYERELNVLERDSLVVGNKIIFGLTYHDSTSANTGLLSISNLRLCSGTSYITMTEISNSMVSQVVNGRNIITRFYEGIIPTLTNYILSFRLNYSGSNSCKLLNCALFQGHDTSSYGGLESIDKFSQYVKYDNPSEKWLIRGYGGDFVELTTDHSDRTYGVHGVGSGEVVGTTLTQTLTNKTLQGVKLEGVSGSSVLTTNIPYTNWTSDSSLVSALALKTKIDGIVVSANVDEHNKHDSFSTTVDGESLHGIRNGEGSIVATNKEQTLTNKTIRIGGNVPFITFEKSFTNGTQWLPAESYLNGMDLYYDGDSYETPNTFSQLSGSHGLAVSSMSMKNVLRDLFSPSYYNYYAQPVTFNSQNILIATVNKLTSPKTSNIKLKSEVPNITINVNGVALSDNNTVVFNFTSPGIYTINYNTTAWTKYDGGSVGIDIRNMILKASAVGDIVNFLSDYNQQVNSIICHIRSKDGQDNDGAEDGRASASVSCSTTVHVMDTTTWIALVCLRSINPFDGGIE